MEEENPEKNNSEQETNRNSEEDNKEVKGIKKEKIVEIKKPSNVDKVKSNPWILATIVLGVLCVVLIIMLLNGSIGVTGNFVAVNTAGEEAVDLIDNVFGVEMEYVNGKEVDGVYQLDFKLEDNPVTLRATKDFSFLMLPDGRWLRTADYDEDAIAQIQAAQEQTEQQTPQEIPKSDNPQIELFIMTHCPYGTQAEKGFVPAIKTLGDEANAKIRFVHYFMHEPEEEETLRQVCIREEQEDKWLDYLECFLEDGDSARCIEEVKINEENLNDCIENRADGYYGEDSALSEQYGVRGSPTLVIDGEIVSSGRSPDAMLTTICSSYNTEPDACSAELASENPSPGFGYTGSGTATDAQC